MKYILENSETKRLKFRLLEPSDFDAWLPLFHNKTALRNLGMSDIKNAKEGCQKWMDKCLTRYEENTGGMNVMIDKNSGELIGQSGLLIQEIEGQTHLEVGYSILPKFWGKGYATEAAKHCRDEAFKRNFADELISMVHVENDASKKVALKNGMTFWKFLPDFKSLSANVFRISKEEWKMLESN